MSDCIFCKIINGEIPSYTIYEDSVVKVFLSIEPIHNGHTLIIPKKHYTDFNDIDDKTLEHISKISRNIYKLLEERLNFDGLKLVQNNGTYQDVKHYHLHLIPDYKNEKKLSLEEVHKILK